MKMPLQGNRDNNAITDQDGLLVVYVYRHTDLPDVLRMLNSHAALLKAAKEAYATFHATDLAKGTGEAMDALEAAIREAQPTEGAKP